MYITNAVQLITFLVTKFHAQDNYKKSKLDSTERLIIKSKFHAPI